MLQKKKKLWNLIVYSMVTMKHKRGRVRMRSSQNLIIRGVWNILDVVRLYLPRTEYHFFEIVKYTTSLSFCLWWRCWVQGRMLCDVNIKSRKENKDRQGGHWNFQNLVREGRVKWKYRKYPRWSDVNKKEKW